MANQDSRTEIVNAINEINERKTKVAEFIDESTPDLIKEILEDEITDLVNAAESLDYVLENNYEPTCTICNKKFESEYPASKIICQTCDDKSFLRQRELAEER